MVYKFVAHPGEVCVSFALFPSSEERRVDSFHIFVDLGELRKCTGQEWTRRVEREGEPANRFTSKRTTLAFMRAIMRARRLSGSYIVEERRVAAFLCAPLSVSVSPREGIFSNSAKSSSVRENP